MNIIKVTTIVVSAIYVHLVLHNCCSMLKIFDQCFVQRKEEKARNKFILLKKNLQYLISGFWALTRYWRCNPLIIHGNRAKAFHDNIFILSFCQAPIFSGNSLRLRKRIPILNHWLNFWIMLWTIQKITQKDKEKVKNTIIIVRTKMKKS